MPKACPYVIIRFLFVLSVNLNSKYWFFAEGEMFFYVFVSVPQYFSTEPQFPFKHGKRRPWVVAFLDWNWYVSVITSDALEHWWATRTATAWRWSAWAVAVATVTPSVLLGGLVAL